MVCFLTIDTVLSCHIENLFFFQESVFSLSALESSLVTYVKDPSASTQPFDFSVIPKISREQAAKETARTSWFSFSHYIILYFVSTKENEWVCLQVRAHWILLQFRLHPGRLLLHLLHQLLHRHNRHMQNNLQQCLSSHRTDLSSIAVASRHNSPRAKRNIKSPASSISSRRMLFSR